MRHTRWRWKIVCAFPAAVVPDFDDALQMAVFLGHLAQDQIDRQEERYADAFLSLQQLVPQEAAKTLDQWRDAILAGQGPPGSLYDRLKGDPIWALADLPPQWRRERA